MTTELPDSPESLRKSLQIYKGLVEVSGLINSIEEYGELLKAVLNVARRVIQVEAASLFLVNEETGALELVIATAGENGFAEPRISVPKGKGIAGWVFEKGEALLIPDAYADSRFYKEADRQTGFVTRSILCAPLKSDGRITGILQVLNPCGKTAFEPEDLDGFCAYADLTATALEKVRSREKARAQERIEHDLAIASEIQKELLSRAIPTSVPGWVFAAHNAPAANVGGDFYGVFPRPGGDVYFVVGDVSGKGISASLLMAQTLSAMTFVFAAASGPADALEQLNATLSERIVRGMFVTSLVGKLPAGAQRVELASAGHCQPILLHKGSGPELLDVPSSLPIGVMPRARYAQATVGFVPGDCLILYTDGLSESRAAAGEAMFDEKLLTALAGGHAGPRDILGKLLTAEKNHRGRGAQMDDLTVLAVGFQ
jgi:sigma-B regulation protein RsbU (phosphoserine phosphatase)